MFDSIVVHYQRPQIDICKKVTLLYLLHLVERDIELIEEL